jgi:hypothetical protein
LNHKFFVVQTYQVGGDSDCHIKSFDKLGKTMEFTLDVVLMNERRTFDKPTEWKVEVFQRHSNGTCHRVCYKSKR